MTVTTTKVERSGPAVRAALAQFSPPERSAFEEQFQHALAEAEQRFDLGPVQAVLDRWWPVAAIRANPLSPAEQDLVRRARTGDDTGCADHPVQAAVTHTAARR